MEKNEEKPYLEKIHTEYLYNPNYGDDRTCICGHPYHRHFDSYEDMSNVGCKYCQCFDFEEDTDDPILSASDFLVISEQPSSIAMIEFTKLHLRKFAKQVKKDGVDLLEYLDSIK